MALLDSPNPPFPTYGHRPYSRESEMVVMQNVRVCVYLGQTTTHVGCIN
jgi:hypothetical protein